MSEADVQLPLACLANLLLLIHSWFGCCVHHAHGGQTGRSSFAVSRVQPIAPSCCTDNHCSRRLAGFGAAQAPSSASAADSKATAPEPAPCPTDECVLLRAGALTATSPPLALAWCALEPAPAEAGWASRNVRRGAVPRDTIRPAQSLRSHLLLGVLLI